MLTQSEFVDKYITEGLLKESKYKEDAKFLLTKIKSLTVLPIFDDFKFLAHKELLVYEDRNQNSVLSKERIYQTLMTELFIFAAIVIFYDKYSHVTYTPIGKTYRVYKMQDINANQWKDSYRPRFTVIFNNDTYSQADIFFSWDIPGANIYTAGSCLDLYITAHIYNSVKSAASVVKLKDINRALIEELCDKIY